jgi:hypothetical protein
MGRRQQGQDIQSLFITSWYVIFQLQFHFASHSLVEGFDPSKDTPIEILHTILLGVVKYLWHGTHTVWTAAQKTTYTHRLQATDATGLSIHAIRANYIMQYANSLIGQQLKTIVQTNVFHVYDLTDEHHFLLTKAVGVLTALLWYPEIGNLGEYLVDAFPIIFNLACSDCDFRMTLTLLRGMSLIFLP